MLASLRLAQIYIKDYATENHIKIAFSFLKNIVQGRAEKHPHSLEGRLVGISYFELGLLYLNGKAPDIKMPDMPRAYDFFHQSAVFYGNIDAQYQLSKLILQAPEGVKYDFKQAIRWLTLAANKSQYEAQADLGYMFFEGKKLPRNAPLGLMYLTLANDGAPDNMKIKERYSESMANASDEERKNALLLIEKWVGSEGK